jgi:hypothetical protein
MTYSQPGIYNVLDYGMIAGDSSPSVAQSNAQILQEVINLAQVDDNVGGAIILIPSYSEGSILPEYGPYYLEPYMGNIIAAIPEGISSTMGYPLLICGTGSGTTLVVTNQTSDPVTLFSVDQSPFVTFQDLTVQFDIEGSTNTYGTAFEFTTTSISGGKQSEGYNLFRVNILDFETGIIFSALFQNALQCNITYDEDYPANQGCTGILLAGPNQTNVEQCSLSFTGSGGSISAGTIGIVIDQLGHQTADGARVCDTQISGFETGISLGPTGRVQNIFFLNLDIASIQYGVEITQVWNVGFVDCAIQPYSTSTSPPITGPGILLSNIAGGPSAIDSVSFTNCTVVGYPSGYAGLEIVTGQNIQVNGGTYSGNAAGGIAIAGSVIGVQINAANCIGVCEALNTSQLYGISITDGQDIQIIGVNCSGNGLSSTSEGAGIYINGSEVSDATVENVRIVGAICTDPVLVSEQYQQYGIYVQQASGVGIDGCELTGNTLYALYLDNVQDVTVDSCDIYSSYSGAAGIYVTNGPLGLTSNVFIRGCNGAQYSSRGSVVGVGPTPVTNLQVTDCVGYNDQAAPLATSFVFSVATPFSGLSLSTPYYGPTAFYITTSGSPSSGMIIDGNSTYLTSGSFTLSAGETAEVPAATTVTHFLMVGR